jgi:hypothetical protein
MFAIPVRNPPVIPREAETVSTTELARSGPLFCHSATKGPPPRAPARCRLLISLPNSGSPKGQGRSLPAMSVTAAPTAAGGRGESAHQGVALASPRPTALAIL